MISKQKQSWMTGAIFAMGLASLGLTGCQVSVGGQTLPSAFYLEDDVAYHAPGTEFKLSAEAAAQRAYKADQQLQNP